MLSDKEFEVLSNKLANLLVFTYEDGLRYASGYKVGKSEIKNQSFTKVNYYNGMAKRFIKDMMAKGI